MCCVLSKSSSLHGAKCFVFFSLFGIIWKQQVKKREREDKIFCPFAFITLRKEASDTAVVLFIMNLNSEKKNCPVLRFTSARRSNSSDLLCCALRYSFRLSVSFLNVSSRKPVWFFSNLLRVGQKRNVRFFPAEETDLQDAALASSPVG